MLGLAAFIASESTARAAVDADALAAGFTRPPEVARPWTYWMWMDGNLSREGLTADLEAMRRAGLGGVIIMEVNVGVPQGPVKFMSPEWRRLFQHVVAEAERLGLQITLNAGPGWTGSGGPWVKPEQSMQHLVASAVEVTGPRRFDDMLPRPQRRPAFFGEGGLPPELKRSMNEFYRDVTVLAFPKPAGEVRIEDIDEKALYVRAPYSSQPRVKACLPAPAQYPDLPAGAAIDSARVLDLSAHLAPDGRLAWDVPEGRWTLLRFGRTSTGANTRPAPAPGVGLECDKFDKAALEAHFEEFAGALLRELGPGRGTTAGWTSLHIDSWEMGAQNWTAAFRDEFRRRRGYDPLRYLPTLTGRVVDSLEISERFLWDLRQTAQELVVENHAEHLKTLGRRHGFGLSIEPYDMNPCANMTLGAVADVPMCEFWLYGFNTAFSVIEAASLAHTLGRRLVAAEAFTSTDAERWQAHPASMKALGDWAFAAGVNRIVFHRYQHQPWLERRPGMTMGPYGVHWERTQTWWDLAPAYHEYLARCQFLLRQGLAVADVLCLGAEGAPHVFRPPPGATRGQPPDRVGYNFDACAPETLLGRVVVRDGQLVLPDGMSYRVLMLPERETMTPALLRKVRDLVAAGATVIGPPPRKSPGLSGYPRCDEEVRKLAAEVWGDLKPVTADVSPRPANESAAPSRAQPRNERRFGQGRVVWPSRAAAEPDPAQEGLEALRRAKWIWFNEANPAAKAPVGKRYFQRRFVLEANQPAAGARVSITADNAFTLWLNGGQVGDGDDFTEIYTFDAGSRLRAGTNVLAVAADNGGDSPNPAGLIACLKVRFQDGRTLEIPTDQQWLAARTTGEDWPDSPAPAAGWSAALELGPFGMAPWTRTAKPFVEPEQYGSFDTAVSLLRQLGVPPDFESGPPLRYTHRRDGPVDLYFVANPEERPVATLCAFRVTGRQPELWDPVTGERRPLPEFELKDGRTWVPLTFEPHQSFFVVFREPTPGPLAGGRNFPSLQTAVALDGPWEVAFDPQWGGPARVTFARLEDWSRRPEEGIRFYAGLATYRKTFKDPRPATARTPRVFLDLGVVKNLARVRLNGRDLGVAWCAPWRVDVTSALQAGENHLEITVANLWPNRLIGDEHLPPDCDYGRGGNLARWPEWLLQGQPRPSAGRYTFSTWKHFNKDSPLLPSGLLGPVTLQAVQPGDARGR
jgi:hypothetical protein